MSQLLLVTFETQEAAALAPFAQRLGLPFDVLCLVGTPDPDLGAGTVLQANLEEVPTADAMDKALAATAAGYSHVAFLSSMRGKDVAARVAARLDAAMVTDVTDVKSPSTFVRPMVAGSVIATVEVLAEPVVLTVRPAGFGSARREGASATQSVDLVLCEGSRRTSVSGKSGARPDLTQARVIVSGGRPLKDAETFERVLGGLADRLGGAVGATRAAVDSGIAANELQVGQTGKIVAPDLYIAAGVSGSTQHMAGIKDSKVIVAINKDPDAPIFESADFGLVADLYQALPEMQSKI